MTEILDLPKQIRAIENELHFMDEEDANYEKYKELLESRMKQHKWSTEQTAMYYADLYLEQDAAATAQKILSDKSAKRATAARNRADWTKDYIKEIALSIGLKKLKTDHTSVSIMQGRNNAYIPEGFELSTLPEKYRKDNPATIDPLKREITKALKAGEDVCGLKLLRGDNIIMFR